MPAKAEAPNAFQTSDTKLAACLVALGFPYEHRLRHRQRDSKDYIAFAFGTRSQRSQFASFTIAIARLFKQGALPAMHPLCVMMRALKNRDCMMDMMKGTPMRLVSVADGCMTEFRHGAENPQLLTLPREIPLTDMDLAVCLAGFGIPPQAITGTRPTHVFHHARHGYTLRSAETKAPIMHDARHLLRRAPTAADPLHLALEDEQPLHPMVLSYDVLTVRTELQALIRKTMPSLIVEQAGMAAEISLNYSGRVMKKLAARFGTTPAL